MSRTEKVRETRTVPVELGPDCDERREITFTRYEEDGVWFALDPNGTLLYAPALARDGSFDPEEVGEVAFDLIDPAIAEHDRKIAFELRRASARKMQGAYVQAWVYVDAEDDSLADSTLRDEARRLHGRDGEIEIDDGAEVSRSYEG